MDVETRAATLILRGEAPLVPLSELHRSLAAEAGTEAGDVATLRERLSARPDLFLLLERPSLLAGAEHWSEGDRVAYRVALREAGFEAETLVGAGPAAGAPPGPACVSAQIHAGAHAGVRAPLPAGAPARAVAHADVRAPGTAGARASAAAPGGLSAPRGAQALAYGGAPVRAAAPAGVSALAGWGGGGPAGGRAPAAYGPAREAATTPVPSPLPPPAAMPAPEFSASPAPAARVAAALAQLAASLPPEHLLRGQLADALPLAEATMRVLTEAWRARQQAEAEGWVPADH